MSKINTIQEFTKTVKNAFVAAFPGCKIDAAPVTKNNGLCLTGVTARSYNAQIAPTIYLEEYFADLQSGNSPLPVIIDNMINNYKAALKEAANTDAAAIYNFNSVKHKICYRLVNKKLNYRLLADMPHRDFMDLAIIYCIQLESTDDNVKTIKITDSLTTLWGVNESELYKLASENTPKLNRGCVVPMNNMFAEIVGLPSSSTDEDITQYDGFDITFGSGNGLPVYIATCASKVNGASVILYDGLLEAVAEKLGCSYFLLPSSIHEILIFPGNPKDAESILEMVKTVNTEDVREDEILSNNCFWYNGATHTLELITS